MSTSYSPTFVCLTLDVVPESEARCPPEENPEMPMNEVSKPYSSAFARTKRIAALMSLIWAGNLASMLERWLGQTRA